MNITYAQTVTRSGQVIRVPNCAGFMFTNIGDNAVTLNGMVVFPGTIGSILGDSRTISMQEGEEYVGNLDVAFAIPNTALQALEIVQIFYAQ